MGWKHLIVMIGFFAWAGTALAAEGCKGGPKSAWRNPEDARKAAIAMNHTRIVKIILEDGCYEVVTINADGKFVGVQFDPVTLELHKVEEPQ